MYERKIKVLIVDDSLVFREAIARGISADPAIEVVAKAVDPFDARDKIIKYEPDVVTCDVEMPKMNGIEFIRRLIPQYPLPVIVVSTVCEAVFDAMGAGAVDFVTKPDMRSPVSIDAFMLDIAAKIKVAARAKVAQPGKHQSDTLLLENSNCINIIAIGASTGGTEALYQILKQLPPTIPGIVAVQHIPPVFSRMLAERLNNQTRLAVQEARTGDYVRQGTVYIAPGDHHMRVKKVADKFKLEVFKGEKVNGHCPSVDVLYESVAKECGSSAIGIILTGMGRDGAKGLLAMRRKGAGTIGQDEQSSVIYGMPRVAYEIGAVERQAALNNIPKVLVAMLKLK